MKIVAIRGKNLASLEGEFVIDFTVEPLCSAGIFAITGSTGAGKSTLIKIQGGIYKADSGEIRMHGTVKNITSTEVAVENGFRIIHK